MKILLLSQFFSSTKGGGEYVMSFIANLLAKEGHKVWIITNPMKNENYSNHENIKIIFVPPLLEYKGGIPVGFYDNVRYTLGSITKGISIIKREKIDVIHSNNFAPALAGSMLSGMTGKPHITTIHDIFSLCGKNYWKLWGKQSNISRLGVMLAPFFEKIIIKLKHDAIHTVSEASQDDLIKFGAKKPIYVIHNSIGTQQVLGTKINSFQFVYVGRLVFYKNLEVILKAINIVRKQEAQIRLVIVGGGPHRKNLEDLIKDLKLESHVELKGHVDENEKVKLIASSNALVLPSLCEGFGLVILEAFAQNKPVLVSNLRPMSDIVSHEKTGYVLDPHDENVWAAHLLKLVQDPKLSDKMGKNGNNVLPGYSQELMYQKLMHMYKDVLKI